MSVENTLSKADKLLEKQDYATAGRLYSRILAQFPDNSRAIRGIVTIEKIVATQTDSPASLASDVLPIPEQITHLEALFTQQAFAQVVREGENVAQRFPTSAPLFNLLGQAYAKLGDHTSAIDRFTQAIMAAPDFSAPYLNKAASLEIIGQHSEAANAARAGLKIVPNSVPGNFCLAVATSKMGAWEESLAACKTLLSTVPDHFEALLGAGNAALMLETPDRALEYFSAALALRPTAISVITNITATLGLSGRFDEAAEFLQSRVEMFPESLELRMDLAHSQKRADQFNNAIATCRSILEVNPDLTDAWGLLADVYRVTGQREMAVECREKTLELAPDSPTVLADYRDCVGAPPDHPDLRRLEAACDNDDLPLAKRASISFVLYRIYDSHDDTERAFHYLQKANSLRRTDQPYDIDKQGAVFEQLKTLFSPRPAELEDTALASIPAPHRPVFIVGMPRSGTSLVEQILASHSQAHGAGELPYLELAVRSLPGRTQQNSPTPTTETLLQIRKAYFDGLLRRHPNAPVITDKTPLNFRWVGYALLAFPEARILFARRDSRATCWSNYSHSFTGKANNFGNDLADTARMYHLHLDLMDFWSTVFPDRVYTVSYERLTENQEEESRKLVTAAGLDWEQACLDFHKSERVVGTASSDQVRKKMYKGSSEAWRRYEQYLGPMLEGLEGLD